MKRRIVLSISIAIALAGCIADDQSAAPGDALIENGIGTSPRSEPAPDDDLGVAASAARKSTVQVQAAGIPTYTTTYNATTGKYETRVITDSPPIVDVGDLGQLYYDYDPGAAEVSLVPPICLPRTGLPCPSWPGGGGSTCPCQPQGSPHQPACCIFGPTHRP